MREFAAGAATPAPSGAAPRLAAYEGKRDGAFVFRAQAACSVVELLASLGLSKTVRGHLFARGQLTRGAGAGGGGNQQTALLQGNDRLACGDELLLRPHTTHQAAVASHEPVRVLYEDDFVLAVDKPQGLLVHADGTGAPTLTARVQGYLREHGSTEVPQALQRLDVDTSGAVLFSKAEEFQPLFDALIASDASGSKAARKTYLAVCCGSPAPAAGACEAPLGRDRHDARRMRVKAGGQPSRTRYETLACTRDGAHTLLRVQLDTGRRHQIRVHMAHLGHPLVNDPLYGRVEMPRGLMLHAWRLEFAHPIGGQAICVDAGWPARFDAFAWRDLPEGLRER